MRVSNNVSAKNYNSFGIDTEFKTLIEIQEKDDFFHLSDLESDNFKILGGGSNVLMAQANEMPVVLVNNKGLSVIKEGDDYVLVSMAAGEIWHEAVLWAVANGFGGIENLSLIPGKCGAAPWRVRY